MIKLNFTEKFLPLTKITGELPLKSFEWENLIWGCEKVSDLGFSVEKLYSELLRKIPLNHKIIRIWNLVPHINSELYGLETYKRFCVSREKVFKEFNIKQYPAASAVGHSGDYIFVAILTSEQNVKFYSNPVQDDAFTYPEIYGPSSPSFSRAAVCNGVCYISGTASILGHKSRYNNDIKNQTLLTLSNIKTLSNTIEKDTGYSFSQFRWRVFIRNRQDFPVVSRNLSEYFRNGSIEYCEADICRKELLVEIEGVMS